MNFSLQKKHVNTDIHKKKRNKNWKNFVKSTMLLKHVAKFSPQLQSNWTKCVVGISPKRLWEVSDFDSLLYLNESVILSMSYQI